MNILILISVPSKSKTQCVIFGIIFVLIALVICNAPNSTDFENMEKNLLINIYICLLVTAR